MRVPGRILCSSQRMRTSVRLARVLDALRFGQPLPTHFTFTVVPTGVRMLRRSMRVRLTLATPATRVTGQGEIGGTGG